MTSARVGTAVVGILASLAVTLALWVVLDTAAVFLVVPFVPFLFRAGDDEPSSRGGRPGRRRCPRCGFETADEADKFCPRDGSRLETQGRD